VRNAVVVALALSAGLATLPLACSSGSSGSGNVAEGGSDGPPSVDAVPDIVIDPSNCVPPGTANNSQGIGGYCNPGGGQCVMMGIGSQSTDCSGDVSGTPAHAWFCTVPCTASTNCGTGASCVTTAMGAYCIPPSCGFLGEGGSGVDSGGNDSASDAAGDSSDSSSGDGGATDASDGSNGNDAGDSASGDAAAD
jgi:hypothetical protein